MSSRVIESDLVAGMIVVSTGNVTVNNVIDTKVEVELSSSVNNKTVYGVYAHSEKVNDKMNEQHILKMVDFVKWLGRDSDSNVGNDGYVKYQIGQIPNGVSVPSNATYYQDTIVIENPNYNSNHFVTVHYSASVGEGTILVTNIGGEIENGDYITSSAITGYGQKQSDDILRSYTVAKCTQTIDWDSVNDTIEYNGTSYKKVLIACTYHCG